jgi:putative phosphoribosyl transferase
MRLFKNRMQAAEELSEDLAYLKEVNPVILALANGGVPVGDIVARNLRAPLDVLLLERLTVPKYPGRVVGAVDEHGRVSVVHGTTRWHSLTPADLTDAAHGVFPELQRRHNAIRGILPEIDVHNRAVIIVDEGVDSGARMLGAIAAVKDRGVSRIIVAAPAGATEGTWQFHALANDVVIPHRPTKFSGIQHFYEEFSEVTDQMVLATLEGWVRDFHPQDHGNVKTVALKLMNSRGQSLLAEIDLPIGLQRGQRYPAVIFAHGFDSSSRSARSMAITERLAERGVVCVRLDFTGHGRSGGSVEDATDGQMLEDLRVVHQALGKLKEVDRGRMAVVGSGTGAMIALQFVEQHPEMRALVLRGPVCHMDAVHASAVQTPTLLIHADLDTALFDSVETLNRDITARHRLVRIANTNRLFDDPTVREAMVTATVNWLTEQLAQPAAICDGENKAAIAQHSEQSAPV